MRDLARHVTSPAESHPLDDSGDGGGSPAKAPPFKLRPEVPPSQSRPAACPTRYTPSSAEESETPAPRKRSERPRARLNRAERDRDRQEQEVRLLGDGAPGESAVSIPDRVRAWRELSHREHVAAAALVDENEKWVDAWVPEGWRRYRRRWKRWHGPVAVTLAVTSSDSVLLAVDTECGIIPGSGGDVPGIPDAWCSLFRVHQWNQREREAAEDTHSFATPTPEPAELVTNPSSSPNEDLVSEQLEEDEEAPSDTDSDSERLNFTQQLWEERLQAINARQARQRLSPTGERSSPTALTTIREGVESATLSTIKENPRLEQVLEIRARRSRHLHAIVEEDEIVDTVTTANPQENILPDPTSTVSPNAPSVPGDTPSEPEMSVASFPLGSKTHRREQRRVKEQARRRLREELSMEGGWYFGPAREPPLEPARTPSRLSRLKAGRQVPLHHPVRAAICAHLRRDGQVVWDTEGQLAAVRDKEGTLLLVFWALLKGQRVRVLVDSGASDEFISTECVKRPGITVRSNGSPLNVTLADGSVQTSAQVAYGKLTAETSVGTYSEVIKMRVLPLGIKVDIVLGGRWLRGLSPVTLDYAGWGTVGFQHKGASVKIAGCSPGRSASRKEAGTAMCLEPIVMLSAAQAVR
ncbi:hypothetical protein CYMTET_17518 [Cymbomonas tetramitiformis]|uniref:Uncharacterized protein n=1 Tax=Cymbomonas tetramitiformis TaxID=36881 RepID=A0AAE0G9S5_9CHLO|nr:hypothetical protein CYMTET_17518 [Cymbomonas tetramitiformis]